MLRTLPGVGEATALVMLAEIGDLSRFGSARKLASWAGLTPTVRGFPAPEDLPPLGGVKLVRPRRCAAAGAPA